MGKKGKRGGIPTVKKSYFKRFDDVAKKFEEEFESAADDDLFQPLPPTEDCPICCTPLSRLEWNCHYQPCCGNTICNGCHGERRAFIKKANTKIGGSRDDDSSNTSNKKFVVDTCPFCREPTPSTDDERERLLAHRYTHKRDARACYEHAVLDETKPVFYGTKLNENYVHNLYYHMHAVELGSKDSCNVISAMYANRGDHKKSYIFTKAAAWKGDVYARHLLACKEYKSGQHEIAIRHWKISAEGGNQESLTRLRKIYNANPSTEPGKKFISKDSLDMIYRRCHEAQLEVYSEEREKHVNMVGAKAGKLSKKMKC